MDKPSFEIDQRKADDEGQNGLFGGDGPDVVLSADDLEFHLEDRGGDQGLFGGDGWDRYGAPKDGLFGGDGADVVLRSRFATHEADDASLEVTGLRLDSDDAGLL